MFDFPNAKVCNQTLLFCKTGSLVLHMTRKETGLYYGQLTITGLNPATQEQETFGISPIHPETLLNGWPGYKLVQETLEKFKSEYQTPEQQAIITKLISLSNRISATKRAKSAITKMFSELKYNYENLKNVYKQRRILRLDVHSNSYVELFDENHERKNEEAEYFRLFFRHNEVLNWDISFNFKIIGLNNEKEQIIIIKDRPKNTQELIACIRRALLKILHNKEKNVLTLRDMEDHYTIIAGKLKMIEYSVDHILARLHSAYYL